MNVEYTNNIKSRSFIRFLIGLWPRLFNYIKIELINYVAKSKGANIGKNTKIPFSLAKRSNSNLTIGDN
jgi:hypothetical protein